MYLGSNGTVTVIAPAQKVVFIVVLKVKYVSL